MPKKGKKGGKNRRGRRGGKNNRRNSKRNSHSQETELLPTDGTEEVVNTAPMIEPAVDSIQATDLIDAPDETITQETETNEQEIKTTPDEIEPPTQEQEEEVVETVEEPVVEAVSTPIEDPTEDATIPPIKAQINEEPKESSEPAPLSPLSNIPSALGFDATAEMETITPAIPHTILTEEDTLQQLPPHHELDIIAPESVEFTNQQSIDEPVSIAVQRSPDTVPVVTEDTITTIDDHGLSDVNLEHSDIVNTDNILFTETMPIASQTSVPNETEDTPLVPDSKTYTESTEKSLAKIEQSQSEKAKIIQTTHTIEENTTDDNLVTATDSANDGCCILL